jgi:hypothetical protein
MSARMCNALLISVILHSLAILSISQGWQGFTVKEREIKPKKVVEKKSEGKLIEFEVGSRYMPSFAVSSAPERYTFVRGVLPEPSRNPEPLERKPMIGIEEISTAIPGLPGPIPGGSGGVPTSSMISYGPLDLGGGGGLPIAKFANTAVYVPPTTTAVRYSGPGMSLAPAGPGMNLRAPAGTPVSRGTGPGVGPGKIIGIGAGIGLGGPGGGGVVRKAGFGIGRIAVGEGIKIGGLAGEISEAEAFMLSEEPGAIVQGRGRDVRVYLNFGRGWLPKVDPHGNAAAFNMVQWFNMRSRIRAKIVGGFIRFTDKEIFKYPFIWWCAERIPFELSDAECRGLREYLERGGFIFIDSGDDTFPNYGTGAFSTSVRNVLQRALGAELLKSYRIPNDDPLYHCYYDFDGPPRGEYQYGFLEAIDINGRRAIIISENDYAECMLGPNNGHYPESPIVYKFMTNVIIYVLKNSPLANLKDYIDE